MALSYAMPVTYPSTSSKPASSSFIDLYEHMTIKLEEPPCENEANQEHGMTFHPEMETVVKTEDDRMVMAGDAQEFTSWIKKHPQHWTKDEVLDWVYFVVEQIELDGSRLRGEAYQTITGSKLCRMTREDFQATDPIYGSNLFEEFSQLADYATIREPKAIDHSCKTTLESINQQQRFRRTSNQPQNHQHHHQHQHQHHHHHHHHHQQQQHPQHAANISLSININGDNINNNDSSLDKSRKDVQSGMHFNLQANNGSNLVIYDQDNDLKVDLGGLGVYSISTEIEFPSSRSDEVLPSSTSPTSSSSESPLSPSSSSSSLFSSSSISSSSASASSSTPLSSFLSAFSSNVASSEFLEQCQLPRVHPYFNGQYQLQQQQQRHHQHQYHNHHQKQEQTSHPQRQYQSPPPSSSSLSSTSSAVLSRISHNITTSLPTLQQTFLNNYQQKPFSASPVPPAYTPFSSSSLLLSSSSASSSSSSSLSSTSSLPSTSQLITLSSQTTSPLQKALATPLSFSSPSVLSFLSPPPPPPQSSSSSSSSSPLKTTAASTSTYQDMITPNTSQPTNVSPPTTCQSSTSSTLPPLSTLSTPSTAPSSLSSSSTSSTFTSLLSSSSSLSSTVVELSTSDLMEVTDSDYISDDDLFVPVTEDLAMMSSTSGNQSRPTFERKRNGKKNKASQGNKGNHLWEFVRDLLQDPSYNPRLLKWEDKENGVFRFVQSEAVAQLWGEKKKNPMMTYEKLSRAMRFCRTSGYFDNVPKNGKFPKKLCFMFGAKAHGWKN